MDEQELFGSEFLIRRPLLEAIVSEEPVVLLIDEIDRADDEFEAFLLEVLSDFQITIPEIGTIHARRRPAVILTSNRTRELHDALKRRCLFHWITHPPLEREVEIVRLRVPGVSERLAAEAAAFVAGLRELDLAKAPGVAETIDWAHALAALGCQELDAQVVEQTLGSVLKYREDFDTVRDETVAELLAEARAAAAGAVSDELTRQVVTFGRVLREAGLEVGPGRVADALRGLDRVGHHPQEDVYWTLRTTLVARREEAEPFDRAFAAWFLRRAIRPARAPAARTRASRAAARRACASTPPGRPSARRPAPTRTRRPQRARGAAPQGLRRDDARRAGGGPRADRRDRRASARRRRSHRPRGAPPRAHARHARAGPPVDRHGRRPGAPAFRRRSRRPRKLVVLCDVSGSMEAYTRALLLFLHATVRSGRGVEVFAFGTRLTRLTPELRSRDPEQALARAAARVVDWAAGTRIGASLKEFNDVWGRRALTRGAVVLIVSDGWERQDPELVGAQMRRLHRAAYAVVWVNPLKGGHGLRAARRRHARGAAVRRPLRGRTQPGQPRGARNGSWRASAGDTRPDRLCYVRAAPR